MPELQRYFMQPWANRPVEEANLFNPAFSATLMTKTVGDFTKKAGGRQMPFALVFLVLPIIMHRGTREALPGSTVTALLPWLQENREQLVDFPARVRRLKPFSQEAVMFGVGYGALVLADGGGLLVGRKKVRQRKRKPIYLLWRLANASIARLSSAVGSQLPVMQRQCFPHGV